MTPTRTLAALPCLALALSGLAMTAANADTYDDFYAPTRSVTMSPYFTHPTDIAIDPAATDTTSFVVAENNGSTFSHLQVLTDNPNNTTGYSLGDGTISDTAKSGLAGPQGVGYDSAHRLWVADPSMSTVSVFANGNNAPYTTIHGTNTGLSSPYDVAVAKNGEVFVAELGSNDSIRIFAPGRGGNIEPVRTINQGISEPQSIAIDSKGLIYVANAHTGAGTETITVYPANADSITNPIRTITGANTHLHGVSSIALDSSDNLYVANPYDGANGSITLYLAGANGNVFPNKRFHGDAGSNTGIHLPSGVAVDAKRNVHVVNEYSVNPSDKAVFTFTPFVPLVKPSAPRSVKVYGTSTAPSRLVTWLAPSNNGGTPITKYRVVVKKGTTTLYNKTITTRSYRLLRSKLKSGTNKVYVYAYNKVGSSAAVIKSFTVKK